MIGDVESGASADLYQHQVVECVTVLGDHLLYVSCPPDSAKLVRNGRSGYPCLQKRGHDCCSSRVRENSARCLAAGDATRCPLQRLSGLLERANEGHGGPLARATAGMWGAAAVQHTRTEWPLAGQAARCQGVAKTRQGVLASASSTSCIHCW